MPKMKRPLLIGLTGGIGAGKSLVLQLLRKKKVPILQTDHVGHRLLGEKRFSTRIVRQFGKGVLGGDGRIDRRKLGREVFANSRQREKLNQLLHPEIWKRVKQWVREESLKVPCPFLMVVEVPLLFESRSSHRFDGVLSVSAPQATRQKRLLKRGLNPREIKRREKSQWPQKRKNQAADWVIFNRGGRKELKYAVDRWLANVGQEK